MDTNINRNFGGNIKFINPLIVILFLIVSFSFVFAQECTWYRTYHPFEDPDIDFEHYYIHNIWQQPDSSFIIAGSFYCEIWCFDQYIPAFYGFVMEIDINGNMTNFSEEPWYGIKIVRLPEIGYAYISNDHYGRIKILDNEFNTTLIIDSDSLNYYSINYLEEDNSLIMSGYSPNNFFLQKLDIDGNQEWLQFCNIPFYFYTDANEYGTTILGSNSTSWWAEDLKMIHTNSNGIFQWEQEFDCFGSDDITFHNASFISTSDNGYLIGGRVNYLSPYSRDGFALKTYPDGSIEWLNIYDHNFPINAFIEKDDGYILWDKDEGCSMLAVDLSGELLWQYTFNYWDYQNIHKIIELSNGYLISGDFLEFCYFAKINEEGQVSIQNTSTTLLNPIVYNYPNPFNSITTISFSIQNNSYVQLFIYNIKGVNYK